MSRAFTIKDLRKAIEGLEENTPVVVAGSEHSYEPAQAVITGLARDEKGNLYDPDEDIDVYAVVIL